MNYTKIISKSFNYVKKHRFLWWLGLLAALTEGGAASFSQAGNSYNNLPSSNPNITPESVSSSRLTQVVSEFGRVMGAVDGQNSFMNFMKDYGYILLLAMVFFVIIVILVWYYSFSSKAALVVSINQLEDDKPGVNFRSALNIGKEFCWRFLGLNLLMGLFIIALVSIFVVPIVILFIVHSNIATVIAIILIFTGFLALFALAIYGSLLIKLSERVIIDQNCGIAQAIKGSHALVLKSLGPVVVTFLVTVGLNIAYSFAIMLAVVLLGGVLFGVGYLIYQANNLAAIIYGVIFGLALGILLFILRGIFVAFESSFWTLSYIELTRKSEASHE